MKNRRDLHNHLLEHAIQVEGQIHGFGDIVKRRHLAAALLYSMFEVGIGAFQDIGHGVEFTGELADLIEPGDLGAMLQVAVRLIATAARNSSIGVVILRLSQKITAAPTDRRPKKSSASLRRKVAKSANAKRAGSSTITAHGKPLTGA